MLRSGVSSVVHTSAKRAVSHAAAIGGLRMMSTSSARRGLSSVMMSNAVSRTQLSTAARAVSSAPHRGMASYPDHEVLTMPALSPTMEQGNLASWDKAEGDKVNAGDVLAAIETDKAVVSFDSTEEGYIAKILMEAGAQNVPVGTPVAIMVEDAADIAAFKDYVVQGAAAEKPAAPAAPVAEKPVEKPAEQPAPTVAASSPAPAAGARVLASPAARIAAADRGLDLSQITGTASHNAVCVADVMEAPAASAAAAATAATTVKAAASGTPAPVTAAPSAAGDFVDEAPSMMRQIIAKRLTESKQTIPHYYVTAEVQMDAIATLRAQLNKQLAEQAKKTGEEPTKLSVNDFVIKAAAAALRKVPQVNCSWQDTFVRNYNYVDISVAVSTDAGLITPIVADADLKGLAAISADVKSLAKKARQNKLQPHEYVGGTFTISNLGMFGVKEFSAIINPPQAGILAIGASDQKVIANPNYTADNGQSPFKTVSVMNATCSYDHRVVDGAVGAQWLQAFKEFCENPIKLLL